MLYPPQDVSGAGVTIAAKKPLERIILQASRGVATVGRSTPATTESVIVPRRRSNGENCTMSALTLIAISHNETYSGEVLCSGCSKPRAGNSSS